MNHSSITKINIMTNYEAFRTEDFIQDEFFISWVLHPTKVEEDFWRQWLSDFPEREIYVEQAKKVLLAVRANPLSAPATDADVEDILAFVKNKGYSSQNPEAFVRNIWNSGWFRIAAMLFLVSISAVLFYTSKEENNGDGPAKAISVWTEFKNTSPQSRLVRMSDGSLAILKPNSVLKYPSSFSDTTREVFLKGEAFFEVHKDPSKPFLVHSRDLITKVLGTSFTVRSFDKERNSQVIVNTGKVMVFSPQSDSKISKQSVLVLPHQKVTLNKEQKELVKDTIETTMLLAKETARIAFSFNRTPVQEVIEKLETAYHVKIDYDSRQLANLTVTAALSDLSLDEKLKLICKAVGARCSFDEGKITIQKN